MVLSQLELDVANTLNGATKSTFIEKFVDYLGDKGYLSGYDRHSLGVIVATPEQIKEHGFSNYAKYPGSDISSEPVSIYSSDITDTLRELRSKEGITLIELSEDPKIVDNGLILPFSNTDYSICDLLENYGVEDTSALANKLGLSEAMGGKTLALLHMSSKYPDVLFVRIDGSKYALKGTDIYHLGKSHSHPTYDA